MAVGISGSTPGYYRDIYGEAAITWVPPVSNYNYPENTALRGESEAVFRWEEVSIDINDPQSGALLDFLMPDQYMLQITPDIGWHNELAMFGEYGDTELHNPHLESLGPFSIEIGTLNDHGDNSVSVDLSVTDFNKVVINDFADYLWRAVPWGNGNPGLGGLPVKFSFISTTEQLKFSVDPIIKERRKTIQTITGIKSSRVVISIEDENNPTVYIEETNNTWKASFSIDRTEVKFKIKATDIGGSALSSFQVAIEYDSIIQNESHRWNSFDSFALLASVERLPGELNASLKERVIDAFANKGSTDLDGLNFGINRELGLTRQDNAISFSRALDGNLKPIERTIEIDSLHSRITVLAPSFVIYDEIKYINGYTKIVSTDKRIDKIIKIKTLSDLEIPEENYYINEEENLVEKNEIIIDGHTGTVKITYSYKENISLASNALAGDIVAQLNAITNPNGNYIISAALHKDMTGSELSKYINKGFVRLSKEQSASTLGWSNVGLQSISNRDYKWSFANDSNTFFDSAYYAYVLELKSNTNIEWGTLVSDKDFWDVLDSDSYGRDSLPMVFDVRIANYRTALGLKPDGSSEFDPWEAFRMSYFYKDQVIKNAGFPQVAFRSGVGYKKDCRVALVSIEISAEDNKVNLNPISFKAENTLDIKSEDVIGIKLII